MALAPPEGFIDLASVTNGGPENQINTIGVVVDFLPAIKSGGPDMTIKFTLHDQSWTQGIGLAVRFFHKQESQLPKIQNQGDVVILRNVKLKIYGGVLTLLSNSATNWVVIENSSLLNTGNGSNIIMNRSGAPHNLTAPPNDAEISYSRALLSLEYPGQWQQPAKPTALQVSQIQRENGGTPAPLRNRFRRIEELKAPQHENDKVYVDLFAEVRRLFSADHNNPRVELSITDYTEHNLLYKHSPEPEDPDVEFDGDRFRYMDNARKVWPGPWGKMTLLVVLWSPHEAYAVRNVEPGSFVFLKNLQIIIDKDGTKLEGHLRTDKIYESRVNISVHKAREASGDERFTALLQRKRDYEEYCKKRQLRFMRDPKMPIKTSDFRRKEPLAADDNDGNSTTKAKRNRDRKQRQRDKSKFENKAIAECSDEADVKEVPNEGDLQKLSANAHVRCNDYPISLTTICSILDPTTLLRDTPSGNRFYLPFQNSCYKSKVRVVDFFPNNLEDFAAPVRESHYAAIDDDGDSESDVDMDAADADTSHPLSTGASADGDIRWQWRFILLVEDAWPPPPIRKHGDEAEDVPAQIELLVADTDADFLLRNIDACDLRKNPKTLAVLREKLFVLWGDLQERKEEVMKASTRGEGMLKASARPFECFIKEYGIPASEKDREWERMFRLCYTCI